MSSKGKDKEALIRAKMNQKLTESGEKEKLQEMLRSKLVECGWREEVERYCKDVVNRRGIDNITVDDMIEEVTPKARAGVPDDVKRDLLLKIRGILAEKSGFSA